MRYKTVVFRASTVNENKYCTGSVQFYKYCHTHTLTPPPQSKLASLLVLDLYNCPVTELKGYREQVFQLVPSLTSLDGFDRSGAEVEDSDEGEEEGGCGFRG